MGDQKTKQIFLKHMFRKLLTFCPNSFTIENKERILVRESSAPQQERRLPVPERDGKRMARNLKEDAGRSLRIKKKLRIAAAIGVMLLVAGAVLFLVHNYQDLYRIFTAEDPAAEMDRFLDGNRLLGAGILLLVQIVQILLAFIPGGPMQMVAGALYGGLLGGLILLGGAAVASLVIWWLVSWLGQAAVEAFHGGEQPGRLKKIRAFREEKSAEALTWILFLIPGVPKDLLTYFAPLTPMKRGRFILISTVARIPGIFLTTFASSNLLDGQVGLSAVLYLVMFAGALGGGWYYKKLHRDSDTGCAEREEQK